MIQIGAQLETIREAREAILEIMCVPYADTEVKLEALRAFNTVCSVNNVNLSNMTLTNN